MLVILFPLIILTGLTMSPGYGRRLCPWLVDVFGGRQTARTIHFVVMAGLFLLFLYRPHRSWSWLAGPFNELRSMITGWYRVSPPANIRGDRRQKMSNLILLFNRRSGLLGLGCRRPRPRRCCSPAATSSTSSRSAPTIRSATFLERANGLTYRVQRLLGAQRWCRNSPSRIRQGQRPNGVTAPDDDTTGASSKNFADYRLHVTGLVEKPPSVSRDELTPCRPHADHPPRLRRGLELHRQMDRRSARLLLDRAGLSRARSASSTARSIGGGLSGPVPYYESWDLIDACHPQTILAYGLNGKPLPVATVPRSASGSSGSSATRCRNTCTPSKWSRASPPSAAA